MKSYLPRKYLQIGIATITAFFAIYCSGLANESLLKVGTARIEITPDYPVLLNGFLSRQQESIGVRQKIWAKALCIEHQGSAPLMLITVDALGIPASLWQTVFEKLEPLGIRQECLAITATHTHSAPIIHDCANNILGRDFTDVEQQHIDRYSDELKLKLIEVAQKALQNRQPAKLSWTIGSVEFAKNRRSSTGPIDHQLPTLAVHDASGILRAVYVSYACHCVTLAERMISGDWAGYAQENIESRHPGCVALVSIGCAGDQNPNSPVASDRIDIANEQGRQIADEVTRLLSGNMKPVIGPVEASSKLIDLPLVEIPSKEDFAELAKQDTATGYHARKQLNKIDLGEQLPQSIAYPIQAWKFGNQLSIVFWAGEVTVEYGLRLKAAQPTLTTWVNAYSNACPCYIPSEAVLKQAGYEGRGAMIYYDQNGVLQAGIEDKIINATEELLDR